MKRSHLSSESTAQCRRYFLFRRAKTSVPHWLDGYQKVKAFVERFYPDTEIISVNPMGLRGLYSDVYTDDFIADHPEIDSSKVTRLNSTQEEK